MKEHLVIKGMDFISNQMIKVMLIPDPEYKVETTEKEIDYTNLDSVFKSVNHIVQQSQELERIIYIGVDEWKEKKYGLASKVVLEIGPGVIDG